MSQAVETPEREAIVRPSPALAEQLGAVRQKHLFVQCGGGVALALGALALALMAGALLDWWIELPWAVRALLLAADIALVGYILWNYVVVPYQEQPDDDSVALVVEKGKPEFRSRLIASLQLTRPESAQPNMAMILVQRLVLETEKLADSMDFTGARSVVAVDGAIAFAYGEADPAILLVDWHDGQLADWRRA